MNGYVIPGLLPTREAIDPRARWGNVGSRVRGFCNRFGADEGYGFIGYWPAMPKSMVLTATETERAYFKGASLADASIATKLPSRAIVLEFDLAEPWKPGLAMEAKRIEVISGQ